MTGLSRRLLWAGTGAFALLASAAMAVPAGAAEVHQIGGGEGSGRTIIVDTVARPCPGSSSHDLRLAAASAPVGSTLLVCPGTHQGPVVVTRKLTFVASRRGGENGHGEGSGDDPRHWDSGDGNRQVIVVGGLAGDGFTLLSASSGTVIDGFVIKGGDQGFNHAGINVLDPTGAGYQIRNNLITENNVGMYFHSGGTNRSRIERNAFVRNNAGGFNTPNSGTAIFTQGFKVNDTLIENNYFTGHKDSALNLGDGSARGLVINQNTSVNDATLLVLRKAAGSVVSNNRTEGTYNSALYLFGDNTGTRVIDNHLHGAPTSTSSNAGIRLTGPIFGTVGPNTLMTIARNDVRSFAYGIGGRNVTASAFDHNDVRDNRVDGIQLSATASNNRLTENRASDDGVWDCHDQSLGLGTAGTANFWVDNRGEKANPEGICD